MTTKKMLLIGGGLYLASKLVAKPADGMTEPFFAGANIVPRPLAQTGMPRTAALAGIGAASGVYISGGSGIGSASGIYISGRRLG